MKFPQAHRRQVLGSTAAAFAGFAVSGASARDGSQWAVSGAAASKPPRPTKLVADPNGLRDLHEGFSYRILS